MNVTSQMPLLKPSCNSGMRPESVADATVVPRSWSARELRLADEQDLPPMMERAFSIRQSEPA